MDRVLDEMAAGQPGTTAVFGLTLGGTLHQRVFLGEARAAAGILSEKYDAADRMATLVNSAAEAFSHPMAGHSNLRSAFSDIGGSREC